MQKIKADKEQQNLKRKETVGALETTATDGSKSTILFPNSTSLIETPTGHTDEERYTELLKSMSKEHISTTGADITVANGIGKQRVLGAEIKGNTIKNYFLFNGEFSSLQPTVTLANTGLEVGKVYTLIGYISKSATNGSLDFGNISFDYGMMKLDCTSVGIVKRKGTLVGAGETFRMLGSRGFDCSVKDLMLLEGDWTNKDIGYFYGLGSTTSTISNNGIKYPLYASLEDKVAKKQILNGSVANVYDKLTLNSDGGLTGINNTKEIVLNGGENYNFISTIGNLMRFELTLSEKAFASTGYNIVALICDRFKAYALDFGGKTEQSICIHPDGTRIILHIDKTIIPIITDVVTLKAWLAQNPTTVRYQLATPTTYTVDKSVNEPIATTSQINMFSAGEAVKPSSFSVTVPTTDKSAKDFTLTPINGYTGSAMGSLLKNGDYELTLDLTVPATFNQVICNIPVELRPSIDRRMVGFNGDTPITLMVTSAGEVKCPTTITGIIKLKGEYKK